MGTYASQFRQDDGDITADLSHPKSADWITSHATATKLAIVEVERMWLRFQQLGCSEAGVLMGDALQKPVIADDIFMKNILTTLRNEADMITFKTFLNAMQWAESSKLEDKIKGIFHLINNGDPIKRDILFRVLRRTYSDDSDDAVQKTTDIFMSEMDRENKGFITEEEFVSFVGSLPYATLSAVMEFAIIPPDINEEAHRAFTAMTKSSARPSGYTAGSNSPDFSKQIPTDNMLTRIAEKVHDRDWQLLANKLNFTAGDISDLESNSPGDAESQVNSMLKSWRSREGSAAYAEVLEKALRDSNMTDAALLLHP